MFVKVQLILLAIAIIFESSAQQPEVTKGAPSLVTVGIDDVEKKYGKKYKNQEEKLYRKLIVEKNKKKINDHNENKKKGQATYDLGQNEFIDLSPEQFSRRYAGLIPSTPAISKYVESAKQLLDLNKNNCDCNTEQLTKKAEIQKMLTKNQYQYNNVILNHYDKKNQVDSSIDQQIYGKKNGKNEKTPGNLKKTPTSIFQSVVSSLSTNKSKLSSTITPLDLLTLNQITNSSTVASAPAPAPVKVASATPIIFKSTLINVDWSSKTGPVRYQGLCGACYAFVATNVVESAYYILRTDTFNQFSVQQVIDCPVSNINGCNGGLLQWAFFQFQHSGVTFQKVYPYTSGLSPTPTNCTIPSGQNRINFYSQLDGTCKHLRNQLQRKPVATSIKSQNLQFYSGGIYNNCTTIVDDRELDHAITIVGFHNSIGWKVKNSWGTTWGVGGYAWVTLDQNRNCGICRQPVTIRLWQESL